MRLCTFGVLTNSLALSEEDCSKFSSAGLSSLADYESGETIQLIDWSFKASILTTSFFSDCCLNVFWAWCTGVKEVCLFKSCMLSSI